MLAAQQIVIIGAPLGGAGKSVPGVLRAGITGVVNLGAGIGQTNLVGAAVAGVVNIAADISLSAGVLIGAAISGTAAFATNLIQTNLTGAAVSGTVSVAADIQTLVPMPSGALGIWKASDFVTSPRATIPNSITNGTTDPNLLTGPRRVFNNIGLWGFNNNGAAPLTAVGATAPDGSADASTVTNVASSWFLVLGQNAGGGAITLPAGTYTMAISVRIASGSTSFQFGDNTTGLGAFTGSSTWQRFTKTFTSTGSVFPLFQQSGTNTSTIEFCDFELFAGSSDLNVNWASAPPLAAQNSDIVVGLYAGDPLSGVSGGTLQNGSFSLLSLPTPLTASEWTVVYLAKHSAVGHQAPYQPVFCEASSSTSWRNFTVGPYTESAPGSMVGGANLDLTFTAQGNAFPDLCTPIGGPFVGAHRYDGTNASSFFNGVKLFDHAASISAPTFTDLTVGFLQGPFVTGHDLYAIAYYDRALSDAEITTAYHVLATISAPSPRSVVFEGTSISEGFIAESFAYLFAPNASPVVHGSVVAVPGSQLSTLSARASTLDSMIVSDPSQTFILSVEVGANDLGTNNATAFTTALATYLDARRAAGWKIVLHTILANNAAADGGTQFNLDRAAANTTIRGWGAAHYDALADVASDATIGTDAAANNTTYFGADKTHPTLAGYTIWEPYTRAAINSL